MNVVQVRLDQAGTVAVRGAAEKLVRQVDRLDTVAALEKAVTLTRLLPVALCDAVARLRARDDETIAVVVSGVDLGLMAQKRTPGSFGEYEGEPWSRLADGALFLIGAALGVPYCFASQQRGRLVLDVFPLPSHEEDQLGCSSTVALEWHNEDAFHPLRAAYTMLLCVRNEQRAATRFVAARELELSSEVLDELRKPQFTIVPDLSHSIGYNLTTSGVAAGSDPAFARIAELGDELVAAPVLEGDAQDPQIRVDFAYMPTDSHSESANAALLELWTEVERTSRSVVLGAGDVLVLDNRRCIHGRDSFEPRYDGTDRWLRRLNVHRHLTDVTEHQLEPGVLSIV
ncbi:TauD/TfdA family dioxygenase [Amycolatopsis sp. A133]|uniref:TauD/TfdA family dioxygenase n=1 Tax=Amycolatopsis sp. A133 TaxID=3064472 RepID=UPI0027E64E72|nr:TauD/TfdA family dioxygenase [Amycolatopsis sp. A133]MDQ7809627.1 TauD/TfdA family dioxygenase [Amycolatopsis sp. A133]